MSCSESLVSFFFVFSAPTGSPLNVTAFAVNSTAITVEWLQPMFDEQNGLITSYRLQVSGGGRVFYISSHGVQRVLTASDLTPYTTYSIRVAAVTGGGQGVFSPTQDTTTDEAGNAMCHACVYSTSIIQM